MIEIRSEIYCVCSGNECEISEDCDVIRYRDITGIYLSWKDR